METGEPDRLGQGPIDVLDVGARRPRRRLTPRTRRVLVGTLAGACLVGGTGWLADSHARADEERALAACHDAALRADTRATTLLASMVAYVQPALYIVRAPERRAGLVAPVARAAADGLPGLEAALQRCAGTDVGRLHRDLADRRSAYVDYLEASVRWLRQVAADGEAYYRDQPQLAGLRDRAFGD